MGRGTGDAESCGDVRESCGVGESSEKLGYVIDALREDGCGAAGDGGDEERGRVVAAELQVAAEFFGVEVDAAFFDF